MTEGKFFEISIRWTHTQTFGSFELDFSIRMNQIRKAWIWFSFVGRYLAQMPSFWAIHTISDAWISFLAQERVFWVFCIYADKYSAFCIGGLIAAENCLQFVFNATPKNKWEIWLRKKWMVNVNFSFFSLQL